jgi:hypothetical protein
MKTVKIHEGTKFEIALDLEADENVLFVKPVKSKTYRYIQDGCLMRFLALITLGIIRIFKPTRQWMAHIVLTNKRLVTVPIPPNKKKMPVESFYFTEISRAKVIPPTDPKTGETAFAMFDIDLKPDASSSCLDGGQFWVYMTWDATGFLNFFKTLLNRIGTGMVNQMNESMAPLQTQWNKDEAIAKGDKYYKVVTAVKYKIEAADCSKFGHVGMRDFLIELINDCAAAANG